MLKKHRRFKLRLLTVQFVTIIPFLLFIFYLFDLWYDTQRSLLLEESLVNAKLASSVFNESFKTAIHVSSVFNSCSHYSDMLSSDKETVREITKKVVDEVGEFDSISIFNTNGNFIISTFDISKEQEESINISDREYFQKVLKTKKAVVSDPIEGKITGKRIIPIGAPIMKNDNPEAVIVIGYETESLKNKIEETITKNGEKKIILLDSKGEIVFISNKQSFGESEKNLFVNTSLFQEAHKGELYLIENKKIPLINENVTGVAMPINESGWVLLSVEPVEYIFAPLFRVQRVIWLIIFSAMIFSLGAASFFLRKVKVIF